MGKTTALRQELKQRFIPLLLEKGFILDQRDGPLMICFRRITDHAVHVCDLQFEKYGHPRFILKFATCPPQGLTIGKTLIKAETIHSWDIPVNGALTPRKGMSSRHWFRQDKSFLSKLFSKEKLHPAAQPVQQLLLLFPEVESYWATGQVGPHCHLYDFTDIHQKMAEHA